MTEKYDMKKPSQNQMIEVDEHFKKCSASTAEMLLLNRNSHRGIPRSQGPYLRGQQTPPVGVKVGQGEHIFSVKTCGSIRQDRRTFKYFFGVFSAEIFTENIIPSRYISQITIRIDTPYFYLQSC